MYDKAAKERQRKGGQKGGESKGRENLPEPSEEQRSRDDAGKAVGVSGKSVDYATTGWWTRWTSTSDAFGGGGRGVSGPGAGILLDSPGRLLAE